MEFLFDDSFIVKELNPEGKKFDRVTRVIARSENYEMDLVLDINTEIYPIKVNERFSLVLSPTLNYSGVTAAEDSFLDTTSFASGNSGSIETLADRYDYVCFGKIYKVDENSSSAKISYYISFGGLLMKLEGNPKHLQHLIIGTNRVSVKFE